jgi:hypothetical protein
MAYMGKMAMKKKPTQICNSEINRSSSTKGRLSSQVKIRPVTTKKQVLEMTSLLIP